MFDQRGVGASDGTFEVRAGDPVEDVGAVLADSVPVDPRRVAVEVEEFVTGAQPAVAPTRTLATVLFTDIVDSTAKSAHFHR